MNFFDWISKYHIDTFISLLALLIAIIGLIITVSKTKRRLGISSCDIEIDSDKPPFISFFLANLSDNVVTITKIDFYYGEKKIDPIDYTPKQRSLIDMTFLEYANNLETPYAMKPYEEVHLSYYMPSSQSNITIKLITRERLSNLRHSISISSNFHKTYEN